jgi:hypothetical protein
MLRYERAWMIFMPFFFMRARATESTLPWNAQELLFGPIKEVRVVLVSNSPINGGVPVR